MSSQSAMTAWCNGQLLPVDAPAVSLLDHGVTVGDGVFETMKYADGTAFALSRHIARLQRSALGLGLEVPESREVAEAVAATILANAEADLEYARIRVTYTSGPGPLGSDRGPGPATLAVTVQPGGPWPETTSVALAPWPRNERSPLVGLKTTSYADNAVALAWAKGLGCSEALLANLVGDLCEGTGSNVFVVVDGRAMTPPVESGCLAGITRELVCEWGEVQQESLPADVLDTCDEVFITSSTRDVHPVTRVGTRDLPVGPVTRGLRDVFDKRSREDVNP